MISDEKIWEVYCSNNKNATKTAHDLGYSGSYIRERLGSIKRNLAIVEPDSVADHLSDLLIKSQTPSELVEQGRLKKLVVGTHPFAYKNAEGEGVTEGLFTKRATFEFTTKPKVDWPPIAPQAIVEAKTYIPLPPVDSDFERVFIWGDTQAHFWREYGKLIPFHDEAAIDCGLQALARYRPHKVIILGDTVDFPGLGRYRKEPAFAQLMNATIAYITNLIARIRAIVGWDCEIIFIPGNHEARLTIAIIENLMELYGIRRPGDNFPLLSIPYLLNFEKYGIECAEQFPRGTVWLTDDLVCMHKPDKSIAATQICGHEIRGTVGSDSKHYRDGKRTYKTYIVPGFGDYDRKTLDRERIQSTNIPSSVGRTNAEQAFATVEITKDKSRHKVTVWEIENGQCFFKDSYITGKAECWEYDEAS